MKFQSIQLTNFKCYSTAAVNFHPVLNCIVGNNGAGKTNLLDALYYCCFTKSYFSSSDQYVYKQGGDFFRIDARIDLDDEKNHVVIRSREGEKKKIDVNESPVARQSDYIGKFNAVMIAPDDNQIILGASDLRRKFMDGCIGQYDNAYLKDLLQYQKILRQRNALLKQYRKTGRLDAVLLDTLDERMSGSGKSIHVKRKEFISEFHPVFSDNFRVIAGEAEEVGIEYTSQLLNDDLLEILQRGRDQDLAAGRTLMGPHRDDLTFTIYGRPLKKTGSQGQQKSFLVALKLGQYDLIEDKKGQKPLLFLDDLMDKFDPQRIEHIFAMIASGRFGQVFITDTGEERLKAILKKHNLDFQLFRVEDAAVNQL